MASQLLPQPEDYHVGWICALETEYVVACELLEEDHCPPDRSLHDENIYKLGRIGKHHVVVTCLPKGKYGLVSAASVAKDMQRSFPAIRIGLMVGIGGGAPSKKQDIRLGDVVVSTPMGRLGGVIQYDFGKTIQNKPFERIGSLNGPSALLLSAVQNLDALHESQGHQLEQTVENMIRNNGRLREKYQRPDTRTDVLYQSSFVHSDENKSCMELCYLQSDQIVQRAERDASKNNPAVHYGLIASADRLIKDAEIRDRLAATEGVLCFEMEAAGLMDRFPCIIIRGICNYSDTHKYDPWKGYAAATAAAYAKELLDLMPPSEVIQTGNQDHHEAQRERTSVQYTQRFPFHNPVHSHTRASKIAAAAASSQRKQITDESHIVRYEGVEGSGSDLLVSDGQGL